MKLLDILFGDREKKSLSAKNLLGGSYKEGENRAEGLLKTGGNMELTQFGEAVIARSAKTVLVTATARVCPEPTVPGGLSGAETCSLPCLKLLIDRGGAIEVVGLNGMQFERVSGAFFSGALIINDMRAGDKISVLLCSYRGDTHFDLMYFGVAEL